jgi:5-formyltetrahydrofolate cyclo-ligase
MHGGLMWNRTPVACAGSSTQRAKGITPNTMTSDELKQWRKAERVRLIAARVAVDMETLAAYRTAIDAHIERAFPGLAHCTVALCWPYKNEYDARFLARRLRDAGAKTALPVVLAPRQPMIFRLWKPGDVMAKGVYDIPYPAEGEPVEPDAALVPMNGFDIAGYRLGYGGGYFDRTLARLRERRPGRPVAIGVTYELARLESIDPQWFDIPMDYVVTERGTYERQDGRLVLLEPPKVAQRLSACSSPPCQAHEFAADYPAK